MHRSNKNRTNLITLAQIEQKQNRSNNITHNRKKKTTFKRDSAAGTISQRTWTGKTMEALQVTRSSDDRDGARWHYFALVHDGLGQPRWHTRVKHAPEGCGGGLCTVHEIESETRKEKGKLKWQSERGEGKGEMKMFNGI